MSKNTHSHKRSGLLPTFISRILTTRAAVIFLLCLAMSLLFVTAVQASRSPAANRIQNPDFETGPGHFYPWFKDPNGTAQWVGAEGCCGQHETFFWPDGAGHGWSSLYNTGDQWDGYIWNENQPGTQWGSLANSNFTSPIAANQRYRLSAWMATSNGNTAYLRWYANGVTNSCGSTTAIWPGSHVLWPTSHNVSCEFTPANTSGFNVHMFANNLSAGRWVVSDDWLLTPLVTVPSSGWPLVGPFPIRYWARDYGNTVDRAANSWNAATGRNLLVKATSEADAKLIVDGVNNFIDGTPGGDNSLYGQTYYPGSYVGAGKQLIEVNMWYFSRWSGDPKQSTVAHELGHVLGLGHVDTCQLMRSYADVRYSYCGVMTPTTKDASSVP